MESWATPAKAAAIIAAVLLPFIAGLAVVVWSRLRAHRRGKGGATSRRLPPRG
jgi:hypothetical protein